MALDARYPSLQDRAVLVTGGASGIGESIVEAFASQGARVAFLDIDAAAGQALAVRLADAPHPPRFQACDLRDIAALQAAVASLGPFTVLVNNAAHDERHTIANVTPEYWDDRVAVNLRHQFFAAQAVAPGMREAGGGSIINIGSTSWHLSEGGMPGYVTSKAGVEGLTRGLARDLGPDRIRVNCVLPGWIMTERQITRWLTPEGEAKLMVDQCLKEKLGPMEVAKMVLWLAADDSRLCTAQNWIVDGGRA